MTLKNESSLWNKLKPLLTELTLHVERIDAHRIPDIHMINIKGKTIWVELKHLSIEDTPKKLATTTDLGLDKDQATWHYIYTKHCGTSYILVYMQAIEEYWVFPGQVALVIGNKTTIDHLKKLSVQFKNIIKAVECILK